MLDPITTTLARTEHYGAWLDELRADDACFAFVSLLEPPDHGEWQAASYLATGCMEIWSTLGDVVLGEGSFAPIVREHERPSRFWSGSEEAVLAWTAHLWRSDIGPRVAVPWTLDHWYRERWLTAIRLRLRQAPELAAAG